MTKKPEDIHIPTETIVDVYQSYVDRKSCIALLLNADQQAEMQKTYDMALEHIRTYLIDPFKNKPEFSGIVFEKQAQRTIDRAQRIVDKKNPLKELEDGKFAQFRINDAAVVIASEMAVTIYRAAKKSADKSLIGFQRTRYPLANHLIPTVKPTGPTIKIRRPPVTPQTKPGA